MHEGSREVGGVVFALMLLFRVMVFGWLCGSVAYLGLLW